MASDKGRYTTTNEMDFLKGLGTFCHNNISRLALLTGYLKGAKKRKNWGNVDKVRVIQLAEAMLQTELIKAGI